MIKEEKLESQIKNVSEQFLKKTENKEILIISHFDTDGISSAAIMIKTLRKLKKNFSLKIIKQLEKEFIFSLPKNKILIFLDLASGSLKNIKESGLKDVFILDHHEITSEIPENVFIVSPELDKKQKISASGVAYLFCKQINNEKDLAKLAVLGMIGDQLEKEIEKINH